MPAQRPQMRIALCEPASARLLGGEEPQDRAADRRPQQHQPYLAYAGSRLRGRGLGCARRQDGISDFRLLTRQAGKECGDFIDVVGG